MIMAIWYTFILNIIIKKGYVTTTQQRQEQLAASHPLKDAPCVCNNSKSYDGDDKNDNNKALSRITITEKRKVEINEDDNLNIDLMSIGSLFRSEYMMKQKQTWASHPSIRSFYGFTELDDHKPYCSVDLDVVEYYNRCKNKEINVWDSDVTNVKVSNVFRSKHYGMDTMKSKGIKAGWLCAQKRPGFAIGKIGRLYKDEITKERKKDGSTHTLKYENFFQDDDLLNAVLPNFLILMDDDTYIYMNRFIPFMIENNKPTQTQEKAKIYAGCLRGDPSVYEKHQIHWVYPWGGFGLIFNRASVKRLIMPIHCNDNAHASTFNHTSTNKNFITSYNEFVCSRIKQNLLGEEKLFKNGMSISDLAYAMSSRKYFCMHSDHLTSYLIHYYNLSDFTSDESDINDNNDEFDFSRIYEYNKNANCADGVKYCDPKSSHVCHRIDSDTMEKYYRRTNS